LSADENLTLELLRRVSIFADLDDTVLRALSARCRRRRYGEDESLFHEGDPGHTLYVIASGTVSIQRTTEDGAITRLARRGAGDPFGEMSLIDGKPRMADAVTVEPSEILSLERKDFLWCVHHYPQVGLRIMAYLADRLREAANHLEMLQSQDVLGRVAAVVIDLMRVYGEPSPTGEVRIRVRVTQQTLAEQVGASRESVNRCLRRLRREKVLRLESRHIVVLRPAALHARRGRLTLS
jgi:CRP-like cAMP-binding protein